MKLDYPGLVSDRDRHGSTRYYYRKKGQNKIRLKAQPGTSEFHHLYEEAARGGTVKASPYVQAHSLAFLINAYFASTSFTAELATDTQSQRRRLLNRLAEVAGDKPFAKLSTPRIHAWMDERADRPDSANNLLKALRGLFKFAVKRKLAKLDPTTGISKVRIFTEGFHTWSVAEVAQFWAHHRPGTKARRAMAIALFTGFRRGNVAGLGRQHLRMVEGEAWLLVKAVKARRKALKDVMVPVLPLLAQELALLPLTQLIFLETDYGKPYSVAGLGTAFKNWCVAAGLPHCSMHGLRKAGATIAADKGASDRQLMAIYGWSNAEQANVYTERRDRALLAGSARQFLKVDGLK